MGQRIVRQPHGWFGSTPPAVPSLPEPLPVSVSVSPRVVPLVVAGGSPSQQPYHAQVAPGAQSESS